MVRVHQGVPSSLGSASKNKEQLTSEHNSWREPSLVRPLISQLGKWRGSVTAAHKAHNLEVQFESGDRNHVCERL